MTLPQPGGGLASLWPTQHACTLCFQARQPGAQQKGVRMRAAKTVFVAVYIRYLCSDYGHFQLELRWLGLATH